MTAEHEPPLHANRYAIERLDAANAEGLAAFVAVHEEAARGSGSAGSGSGGPANYVAGAAAALMAAAGSIWRGARASPAGGLPSSGRTWPVGQRPPAHAGYLHARCVRSGATPGQVWAGRRITRASVSRRRAASGYGSTAGTVNDANYAPSTNAGVRPRGFSPRGVTLTAAAGLGEVAGGGRRQSARAGGSAGERTALQWPSDDETRLRGLDTAGGRRAGRYVVAAGRTARSAYAGSGFANGPLQARILAGTFAGRPLAYDIDHP